MRGKSALFLVVACAQSISLACGLDVAGQSSVGATDASVGDAAGPGPDAATDTAASGDAANEAMPDAGVDARQAACPSASDGPDRASAYRSVAAKTIDGDLGDWGCQIEIVLSASSAAYALGGPGLDTMKAKLEWDDQTIYFAATVSDTSLAGSDPVDNYKNDGVEFYLSGDAVRGGQYGVLDHQWVVDHNSVAVDYGHQNYPPAAPDRAPAAAGFAFVLKKIAGGYVLEESIPRALIQMTGTLQAGATLGVDFALNDGPNHAHFFVWAYAAGACACVAPGTCCCGGDPSCNTARMGTLTLR